MNSRRDRAVLTIVAIIAAATNRCGNANAAGRVNADGTTQKCVRFLGLFRHRLLCASLYNFTGTAA
jgi:hypothetical protein